MPLGHFPHLPNQKVGQDEDLHYQMHNSINKQSCHLQEFRQNHEVGNLVRIASYLSQGNDFQIQKRK